jgi:predicted RNA binding protein YcfA (HicA-like mRNA interferase family)
LRRKEFIKLIEKQGCKFLREGGNHTIYYNPIGNKTSSIPRHSEISDFLCKKICKDLSITLRK